MERDELAGLGAGDGAVQLQIDAALTELGGARPATDLVDRILAAAAAKPVARPGTRHRALVAAAMLGGVAVLAGLFWLQRGDRQLAGTPQDPVRQDPAPQDPAPPKPKDEKHLFYFTEPVRVICDFSENKVLILDDRGGELFALGEVFGAWDAEITSAGTLLITEFSVSRVREVDRNGTIWSFERLKNPYDADRLPNGNTLIADTFGSQVIEVSPEKEIVWKYDKDIRPFDCDRLANGNTLIADIYKDRVIEVDPKGEIVWKLENVQNVHDADRLPNGNTLIVLRTKNCVQEVDREGKVVWELKGLVSPSDADRLPNGNTIVAENQRVREFDAEGKELRRNPTTWSVEVNRYEPVKARK